MLGPKQEAQGALFYEFSIDDHVPQDHLLRPVDRFVDLSGIRQHLTDFYSHIGPPSIDPELLIRLRWCDIALAFGLNGVCVKRFT